MIAQPAETVAAFYSYFGLPFTAVARTHIEEFIRNTPRGGYGVNTYDFEESGLDAAILREQFRPYMATFGIESEWKTRVDASTSRALTPA